MLSIFSLIIHLTSVWNLGVYPPVPGLDQSQYYKIQVKISSSEVWLEPFNFLTECTDEKLCNTTGMGELLDQWSNTYVNFEMEEGREVDVKITKLNSDPIIKAVVHPRKAAKSCIVENGHAVVTINKPGLFTVDINGQMDDQDTGHLPNSTHHYQGPPIHTVTVFANPFIDKPDPEGEGVLRASPGEVPPSEGDWRTLYFLPGVHDIGRGFRVHANKSYYIPGDALVHGTFYNKDRKDGHNIRIYGHGTISGDKIPHPNFSDAPEEEHHTFKPISINGEMSPMSHINNFCSPILGCQECIVEGITIAGSGYASVFLDSVYDPSATPTYFMWVKVFTWTVCMTPLLPPPTSGGSRCSPGQCV